MIEIIGTELYQWDVGRSVKVTETEASHVHFANQGDSQAVIMELSGGTALIPDYLFQTGKQLCVYAVANGVTIERKTFPVKKRERPENYIYDEDHRNYIYQIITDAENAVSEAERVTNELKTARDNGEFNGPQGPKGDRGEKGDSIVGPKGDKGDKGEPGVVKFNVVNELPETGDGDTIYLVPVTDGAEDNLFDEYIWVDGKWEKIGSAAVAVDMTGYVKNTDIATANAVGVVRCGEGLYMTSTGKINVSPATETHIDAKTTNSRVVTPANLDYAIKKGLADNKEEWTEDEKKAARQLIGADLATITAPGIVRIMSDYGVQFISQSMGVIGLKGATKDVISAKTSGYQAVTPMYLDHAVKVGLTDSKEEWSEDEKKAARDLVGAVGNTDYATAKEPGLLKVSELWYGLEIVNVNNSLAIRQPNADRIKNRKDFVREAVTLGWFDRVLKASLTTNAETLTDEEKAAALAWLGAGDKFLEKVTTEGSWYDRVYAVDRAGTEQKMFNVSNSYVANSIAQRTQSGALMVNTPTADNHATTKAYVDGRITANEDGTLTIKLADGSTYKVAAQKEE